MIWTSSISVQWFWRVVIWWLIELDIPQLSSSGIECDDYCFLFTYSLQSSSIHSPISSSFDAIGLENYISFGDKTPSSTSCVVRNRIELDSIPSDVKDLWIGRFDTSRLTEYSFSRFQSLQSLVISHFIFMKSTSFKLNNLPSLQSIDIGVGCYFYSSSFSLTGITDWLVCIHRSSSTTINQFKRRIIPCCSFGCVWGWLSG